MPKKPPTLQYVFEIEPTINNRYKHPVLLRNKMAK